MEENSSVSFSFSKKSEKKPLKSSVVNEDVELKEETDFITSLEGQQLKSVKPKEEVKELIIPLIKTNNWKTQHLNKTSTDRPPPDQHLNKTSTDKPPPDGSLDSLALQEIVQDAARKLESWDERGGVDPDVQIPLLMQNKVPEGFETDDHLDVSLRPDEPEDADYDGIPIESFGIAMLKGMGWKPGQGIGKNNKATAPVNAVLRPKGMGLGADRKQAQTLNTAKQGPAGDEEGADNLIMKKGTACLIEKGPNKDLYGMIEGLDEDNARLMVKLTVSGKSVTVSQYNMRLVTDKEYKQYSKYLNKGAADRYKEKDDRKKNKEDHRGSKEHDGDSEREKKHRKEDDRLSEEKYDRKKDKYRDSEDRMSKKDKYRESDKSSKKRKYEDDRSQQHHPSSSNGQSGPSQSLWVRPNLRVRVVDDRYKKGRFYNQKVSVVDVCDRDHCVCKTDDGKVLEDVSQSMLETVVPKTDSSYVCIVSGKYKGQIARVMERDKKKCQALLQLLSDRDKVLQLDYDTICEYIGDIDEEFDY